MLALIACALAISASSSMIETALLTARRFTLSKDVGLGDRRATAVLALLDDIDAVLATILMWNSFANAICASLATLLTIRLWSGSELSVSISTLTVTIVILIFAEIAPKALGVRFAEPIARAAAPPLLAIVRLSSPLTGLLRLVVNMILHLFGVNPKRRSALPVATDELLALVADEHTLKESDDSHKRMLVRLIALRELSLRDIMVPRDNIRYIDLDDPPAEQITNLARIPFQTLPICQDGLENVVGLVATRQVLAACRNEEFNTQTIRRLMTPPFFVPEPISPLKTLNDVIFDGHKLALVVDEFGGVIGMVTMSDFLGYMVGKQKTEIPTPEGGFIVAAETSVMELNLRHSLGLPEERSRSIGGLITDLVDAFPEHPVCVRWNNIGLCAEKVVGQRIQTVRLVRLSNEND